MHRKIFRVTLLLFQFTPLREGRQLCIKGLCRPTVDFNSRPCGRGDGTLLEREETLLKISIHAPAGGATGIGNQTAQRIDISIHAPAGGATLCRRGHDAIC